MPIKPVYTNDQNTQHFLDTCQREVDSVQSNIIALPDHLQDDLLTRQSSFREANSQLLAAREELQRLRQIIRKEEQALRRLLRHVFQNVRRHMDDPDLPKSTLNHFGLDVQGRIAKSDERLRRPILMAQQVLEANAVAKRSNFDFMIDPTPSELESRVRDLENLYISRHEAAAEERKLLMTMQEERFEAQTLAILVRSFLTAKLRAYDGTVRRQILRAYGFEYFSVNGDGSDDLELDEPNEVVAEDTMEVGDEAVPETAVVTAAATPLQRVAQALPTYRDADFENDGYIDFEEDEEDSDVEPLAETA